MIQSYLHRKTHLACKLGPQLLGTYSLVHKPHLTYTSSINTVRQAPFPGSKKWGIFSHGSEPCPPNWIVTTMLEPQLPSGKLT